jgi:hypothetical protein
MRCRICHTQTFDNPTGCCSGYCVMVADRRALYRKIDTACCILFVGGLAMLLIAALWS